jgi:hypothetical protein
MRYFFDAALPENFGLDDVKQVMEARGYTWAQRIPQAELQLAEEIWRLPNNRGAVRYVYDHFVEVPSIRAESDIHGEPSKILMDLQRDLPFLYTGALTKQALSSSSRERIYALRALAATTTMFHGDVILALKAALKDPDPAIRRLALVCISRYPSFVFAQELDDQAVIESDLKIKEDQLALAKDLREHGKRGTQW